MTKKATITTEATANKIQKLAAKLRSVAYKFSRSTGVYVDPEDIYSDLVTAILNQAQVDPEFINQTDAYIIQFAKFQASHICQKAQVYLRFVDELGNVVDPEDEDQAEDLEMTAEVREKLLQNIQAVETEVLYNEMVETFVQTATSNLKQSELETVYMLYMGYKPAEIAREANISRAAVSMRIDKIAKKLKGVEE
ncbi:hypothetical protein ADN00_15525 [Ornatilinea apprima]|uniref:Uncharacterized protein n=1 Tax=Ornatilinea apprima TaxID=1134406 RepID=A0A0P6WQ96_9CHLR|nr:sigma-70 family RNA polymerase sigma factor [Ornatilinea apprima]KPL72228.1 hypothetical protein ADN00_15525 [Ornatilinea apprima]